MILVIVILGAAVVVGTLMSSFAGGSSILGRVDFDGFTLDRLNLLLADVRLANVTSFACKGIFDLIDPSSIRTKFCSLSIVLTSGPRSEVSVGLELRWSLSLEQVDKSLFLFTCITPPF